MIFFKHCAFYVLWFDRANRGGDRDFLGRMFAESAAFVAGIC